MANEIFETISYANIFSVSSEMDPILVTLFLDNKSLKNS